MSPFRAGSDRDHPSRKGPYIDYARFLPLNTDPASTHYMNRAQAEPPFRDQEESREKIDIIDLTLNSSPVSRSSIHHQLDADRAPLGRTKVESQGPLGFPLGLAHSLSDPSGGSTAASSNAASVLDPSPPPVSVQPSVSSIDLEDGLNGEMPRPPRVEAPLKTSQQVTPPSSTRPSSHQSPKQAAVSKKQTPKKDISDVRQVITSLRGYSADISNVHSQLCLYALRSTKPVETRVKTGIDYFADVKLAPADAEQTGTTMTIRAKQHFRGRKVDTLRATHYLPVCVKSDKPAVPRYRFHHTEIVKNVLSPNSMLKFVPVIRDLDPDEERDYNLWLGELERMDKSCGFETLGSRDQRVARTIKKERTATLSLFLDSWPRKIAIDNCNRTTLIRHMASSNSDDAITPQQKTSLVNLHSDDNMAATTPRALKAARVFTEAFDQVFYHDAPKGKEILLRDVLKLDKSVDEIVESKKTAKGGQDDSEKVDSLEQWIETHTVMGCLICYSNSCEHGDYSIENHKRNFSMDCIGMYGHLCGTCGAVERADPENRHDDALFQTGCQNTSIQRGVSKAVVLGKSQLEGCGYGLFTAEDIAQDEFVIEYTGELIVADEGVRREARRGEAFSVEKSTSYVFSLLDYEGIWVDAAIYGNLSRYINHAVENANVQPGILYVNGEYRIRFSATRNIKAGEELFFNYGENFPNLTKKMIKEKADIEGDAESGAEEGIIPVKRGRGGRRKGVNGTQKSAAQKLATAKIAKSVRTGARKEAPQVTIDDYEALADVDVAPPASRKRKRVVKSDDEDEDFNPSLESEENAEGRAKGKRPAVSRRRSGIQRVRSMGSIMPSDSEADGSARTTPRKRGRARPNSSHGISNSQTNAKISAVLEKPANDTPPPKKRRGRPPKNPRPPSPAVEKPPEVEHVENEIRASPLLTRNPEIEGGTISVDLSQPSRSARGRKFTTSVLTQSVEDPMDVDEDEAEIDATPSRSRGRRRTEGNSITARGASRGGRTSVSRARRLPTESDAVVDSDEEPPTLTPSSRRRRMQKRVLGPLEVNDSESSFKMPGVGSDSDDEDDDDDDIVGLKRGSRQRKLPARFRSSDEES
ncbi:hypothetical protein SGCOL_007013 [Colletotrichum sp. CLE4]